MVKNSCPRGRGIRILFLPFRLVRDIAILDQTDQTFEIMSHVHNDTFLIPYAKLHIYLIEIPNNTYCKTSKSFQKIHATLNI